MQSSKRLMREVYLNQPKDINLRPSRLFQLLKPLHVISKIGDYWRRTFRKHLENDLENIFCISDAA